MSVIPILTNSTQRLATLPALVRSTRFCANLHKTWNTFQSPPKTVPVSCSLSTHTNKMEDSNSSDVPKKKLHKGGKKRRRLKGVGSILTDPGVPVPRTMQRVELIEYLSKSAIVQDDIIAINKPSGLSVSGDPKSTELSFLDLLPEVADAIGYPSAEVAKGPDRDTSGLLLLGSNKAVTDEISQAFAKEKNSKQLFRTYRAVTVGIPSESQGVINDSIGFEQIGGQLMGVIRHDASKRSFQQKNRQKKFKSPTSQHVNKKAETHYSVISSNERLNCALLELKLHTFRKNQLQVHLTHRLHPVLGDHIYSSRVHHVLGVPVHIDPHQAMPTTQDIGSTLKQALLIRSGLIREIPLHLHWYQVLLSKWRNKKDVCITMPPPDYFLKTLDMLELSS